MASFSEKELFETVPVPRAVATLAIPTVISQVVTMIYNLADTFFVGQLGDPYMVAAVSLVSPWFNLLTALGNLFGLGGSSLISRMLGVKRDGEIRYVSAFSIWDGAAVTACFSLASFLARRPLLTFLGASPDTYGYAEDYLLWVVVLGGVPTMVSLALGHLLRSEGHAKQASAGMMFGGILNVILDPVLIFGFHLDVAGAAIATAFSNAASVVFFAAQYARRADTTAALDELNKYMLYAQMPVVSSRYWNMVHRQTPEDVRKGTEGLQIMRVLGKNMAWMLQSIAAGQRAGVAVPEQEQRISTNFIR